jgi:N-acetylneuraminic acid mutarotase
MILNHDLGTTAVSRFFSVPLLTVPKRWLVLASLLLAIPPWCLVASDSQDHSLTMSTSLNITNHEHQTPLFALAPSAPTWMVTGSCLQVRVGNSTTRLASGLVLVAGGNPGINTCELYNPATGQWTETGSMSTNRSLHTATLLLNGEVLVTGGQSVHEGNSISSCEIYNPITGTWSATASLLLGRGVHTASLLPSGRVLIAGGIDGAGQQVNDCELFDPSGTMTSTGPLITARFEHTAATLEDGSVLVIGGIDDGGSGHATSLCEVYDVASGTWSSTASLPSPLLGNTATVLSSGKVLVAGGAPGIALAEANCEIYDPGLRSWTSTGSLNIPRASHAATLLPSGQVVASGGGVGLEGTAIGSSEIYDPISNSWTLLGNLMAPRYAHTSILLANGQVLLVGGFGVNGGWWMTSTPGITDCELTAVALGGVPSAQAAPVIGGPLSVSGFTFQPFRYQIIASGLPTSYSALGLPLGLTLDSTTGFISGTPTTVGTSTITLTAANASGEGHANLTVSMSESTTAKCGGSSAISLMLAASCWFHRRRTRLAAESQSSMAGRSRGGIAIKAS